MPLARGASDGGFELVGPFLSQCGVVVVDGGLKIFDDAVEFHEIVRIGVDEFFVDAHIL